MLFKHFCGIQRDAPFGTNGATKKQTISVANKCLFLPMPSRMEIENQFSVGSGFDLYFPSPAHDIEVGDQVIRNAKTYNVRAVRQYEVERVGHTHCLVTKDSVK